MFDLSSIHSFTKDNKLKDFINLLYINLSDENIYSITPDILYQTAQSAYLAISVLKNWKIELNQYKSFDKEKNKTKEFTVIQILNKDMPFLVDSLTNELKAWGLSPIFIAHPILAVKRNPESCLLENFSASGSKGENVAYESIIQFYLPSCNIENFEALKNKLEQVLECVYLANNNWTDIRNLVEHTVSFFDTRQLKKYDKIEAISFLNWILNNNFIFLGSIECKFDNQELTPFYDSALGIMKSPLYPSSIVTKITNYDDEDLIFIRKCESKSLVHRTAHLDCIYIKKMNDDSKMIGFIIIIGFFSSAVYYQSVRNIPIVSRKVTNILNRYNQPLHSFNVKEFITALESFPRSELLQMSEDELYTTATGIVALSLIPKVKLFIRKDKSGHFISCLVYVPKSRFGTDIKIAIEKILCQQFGGNVSKSYVLVGESELVRLQIIVNIKSSIIPNYNIENLEGLITSLVSEWSNGLLETLKMYYTEEVAQSKLQKYLDVFDARYSLSFTNKQAVRDIEMIEKVLQDRSTKFDLYVSSQSCDDLVQLKIFSLNHELLLSSILPTIEKLGLLAVDMSTYMVKVHDKGECSDIYLHHLRMRLSRNFSELTITSTIEKNIETLLEKVANGLLEDDIFNSLVLYASMSPEEAMIMRSYAKYLKQIKFAYNTEVIANSLIDNRNIAAKLVKLFNAKFDVNIQINKLELEVIENSIIQDIASVENVVDDKVLKTYLELIKATQRTNFFKDYSSSKHKEYLSLKIESTAIKAMPVPKPFMEIFVYSSRFEALHLRGGKVARGGMRWSDRNEDFRTEILGLMKAQMTKNSVIVPVGSKGGFVLKRANSLNKEQLLQEGIACYKNFLRGLLDITDNIINNIIVKPEGVRCYDMDDPYLVIAADKGTATFSDYANDISSQYGFWLGDAFASGGSAGYDHKKIAITARGAWISVEEHFSQLGINIAKQHFSVIGIGDMSGDVFGNGLLYSNNIKLIAAFNHLHIFIDPTPDTAASFKERERLFQLPGSQWSDYNHNIISNGGGIFSRNSKEIKITAEMREALGISLGIDALTPDELVRHILKAPVDLLWNGGIGTYVKASEESNEVIGDKNNDFVRINGKDLRCKAVAEGGNLGLTQIGRIEYARNGGKINTDFIDNSAGVDCSDHEVNIKIGFSPMLRSNIIDMETRNKVLTEMTEEIAALVLNNNKQQNQLLSLDEYLAAERLDKHIWLIDQLEKKGELNREVESLPNKDELMRLKAANLGLTRPEISVIIAYAKNSAVKMLESVDFTQDPYFLNYLMNYFPTQIRERYSEHFKQHSLKNEIIATVLINDFINTMGAHLFHQILDGGLYQGIEILKSFILIKEGLGVRNYWDVIEKLRGVVTFEVQVKLFSLLQKIIEHNISWLLNHCQNKQHFNISLDVSISKFQAQIQLLRSAYEEGELSEIKELGILELVAEYSQSIPEYLLNDVKKLVILVNALEISNVADYTHQDFVKVAKFYYSIREQLKIDTIIAKISEKHILNNYLDQIAYKMVLQDINLIINNLVITILTGANENSNLANICTDYQLKSYLDFIASIDVFVTKNPITTLVLLKKHLKSLTQ